MKAVMTKGGPLWPFERNSYTIYKTVDVGLFSRHCESDFCSRSSSERHASWPRLARPGTDSSFASNPAAS